MKRKLGILSVIIGVSLAGWCQNDRIFNDIGVIVGAGVSHHQGWGIWDPSFGFLLGVETSVFEISKKSSIKSGIVFTLQGGPNYKRSSDNYNGLAFNSTQSYHIWSDGEVSLYYVKIPILYHFKSNGGLYLEGGIQPGILIGAKKKVEDSNDSGARDAFKTFEFGIPTGIGYWFNDKFSIGARADFGLTNMNSTETI